MGLACRKRHLAPWLEPFWWCNCNYHNVATYRVLLLRLTAAEELRALARSAATF